MNPPEEQALRRELWQADALRPAEMNDDGLEGKIAALLLQLPDDDTET